MPKKSPRQCNDPGCGQLTYDSYCELHSKEVHKEYKRNRTDKREQAFYSSAAWKKVREHKRAISPLCEVCLPDRITPMDIVHHYQAEVKEDWSRRLDLSNLQSVCFSCHNKLHANKKK
ncbi:HNH endonuclease [Pseudalkalibacillus sp. JSM 102089]|uniref:HNH endonuclease n=1 Tax=Pseudalkalibacillus sp. JSM 102089 TaxID=3229856 RepID=UPI00352509FF